MKKKMLIVMTAFMLIGTRVHAGNGDLIVNGNLAVGTTSLAERLNVNGSLFLSTSGSLKSESAATNFNYLEISPTAWGQGAAWLVNATYTNSTAPWSNSTYKVNAGTYNTAAGILNFDGNAKTWKIGASPVSLGAGQPVTWTQLGNLSSTSVWFSPRANSSDLYVSSSGNVGIGSNSPGSKLEVMGASNTRITESVPSGTNGRYSDILLRGTFSNFPTDTFRRNAGLIRAGFSTATWGTGYLSFGVAGDDCKTDGDTDPCTRMIITNNGKVGVGTTNPTSRLAVLAGGYLSPSSVPVFDAYGTVDAGDSYALRSQRSDGTAKTIIKGDAWGNISLQVGEGAADNFSSMATALFVQRGGNVGVGTTSPVSLLTVGNGTYPVGPLPGLNVATNGNSYITVSDNNRQVLFGADSSDYGMIGTFSNHSFVIRVNNAEKVRITNAGNVGIGTSTPLYKLTVDGTAYNTYGVWMGSDIKLKKNLLPISDALSKVLKMEGVSYEWKEDYYKVKESPEGPEVLKKKDVPEGRHYGVVAHEIEKVMPEVVKEGVDGTRAVAYMEIIPVLIEAIKEQQKIIEQQQVELKDIRAMINK